MSLKALQSRLDKLRAQLPIDREQRVSCLVPPADMYLFTEQEQQSLRELEQRVIPLIPTGHKSVRERDGGPDLALFAICAPVSWSFKEMGVLERAEQELSNRDWWQLPRWWDFYKNLIIASVPQERRDRNRRFILCSPGDLVVQFFEIDIEQHREQIEKASIYPFIIQNYQNTLQSIQCCIEEQKPIKSEDIEHIEYWLDFLQGYELIY